MVRDDGAVVVVEGVLVEGVDVFVEGANAAAGIFEERSSENAQEHIVGESVAQNSFGGRW